MHDCGIDQKYKKGGIPNDMNMIFVMSQEIHTKNQFKPLKKTQHNKTENVAGSVHGRQ